MEKTAISSQGQASGESKTANNLILDSWPPEPGENKFLSFEPLSLWYFVLAALKTGTEAKDISVSDEINVSTKAIKVPFSCQSENRQPW